MGGAKSKGDLPAAGQPPAGINASRPFFFLASCPNDLLTEATVLADRYGGFHCVGDKNEGFTAWKGKAVGQFMTLKRLSPHGRKVVGIAIAGFGHCNNERDFLRQLGKKKDHEQFELKQCGDTTDMERWLQSEGYRPVNGNASCMASHASRATASYAPNETSRTQPITASGLWASVNSLFGGGAAGAANGDAWKERYLLDAHRAVVESERVDQDSADALREARTRLGTVVRSALVAGIPKADLQRAESRDRELERLLRVAESRRGFCRWCCCSDAHEWKRDAEGRSRDDENESQVRLAGGLRSDATFMKTDTEAIDEKIKAIEEDIRQREKTLEHQKHQLAMKTMLPASSMPPPLPPGTRCRYRSARNGWLNAVVVSFNADDGTLNLDVRPHAKLQNIHPAASVRQTEAWPAGTPVEYESSSAGHWVDAVVRSFNQGAGASAGGTYNLDVRECASAERIRLRCV